jgi:hypothetical protein
MIELYINNKFVDLSDDVNIRIDKQIFDVNQIKTNDGEFSYSIDIPATDNNKDIFSNANILSVRGKYAKTYSCKLYADSLLIFEGVCLLNSTTSKSFNCNLINLRINDIDTIFGDKTFNSYKWEVPFSGITTINTVNSDTTSKYCFPVISYGVFPKSPSGTYGDDYKSYTDTFTIDNTNRWYYTSFPPSLNLIESVKRLFNSEGYTVDGNIFNDEILNNIYMSLSLNDSQPFVYNYGQEIMGKVSGNTSGTINASSIGFTKKLRYPFQLQNIWGSAGANNPYKFYNFDEVNVFDLLSSASTITHNDSYMFDNSTNNIVIPADGWYDVHINGYIYTDYQELSGVTEKRLDVATGVLSDATFNTNSSVLTDCPFEIQMIKVGGDSIDSMSDAMNSVELIGSSQKIVYGYDGNRANTPFYYYNVYPHERDNYYTRDDFGYDTFSLYRTSADTESKTPIEYDMEVNPNFICGVSDLMMPSLAVCKNKPSWMNGVSALSRARNQNGYYASTYNWSIGQPSQTFTASSIYNDAYTSTNNLDRTIDPETKNRALDFNFYGEVYLKRNDIINLVGVQRNWVNSNGSKVSYTTRYDLNFALSAREPLERKGDTLNSYQYNFSNFSTNLNLFNFMNKEMKVSDFLNNFLKQFNLSYSNNGNTISINTTKLNSNSNSYIDLDNRTDEHISQNLNLPSSYEVRYDIDANEYGFELTVPDDHLYDDNWQDFGDSGSTKIIISELPESTAKEENVGISYSYYKDFQFQNNPISLLTIGDTDIFFGNYEDLMKEDGYSKTLRYYFRTDGAIGTLTTVYDGVPYDWVIAPKNFYNGVNLSYKTTESSLLDRYFNLYTDVSGEYVELETYLTAEEYLKLTKGVGVKYDYNIYLLSSISGFDPSGKNKTKLKLIRKQ